MVEKKALNSILRVFFFRLEKNLFIMQFNMPMKMQSYLNKNTNKLFETRARYDLCDLYRLQIYFTKILFQSLPTKVVYRISLFFTVFATKKIGHLKKWNKGVNVIKRNKSCSPSNQPNTQKIQNYHKLVEKKKHKKYENILLHC